LLKLCQLARTEDCRVTVRRLRKDVGRPSLIGIYRDSQFSEKLIPNRFSPNNLLGLIDRK
jgi:hypothetical protein